MSDNGGSQGDGGVWRGRGRESGVTDNADAGLADVFDAEDDFVAVAERIEGDIVADKVLLEAFEVKISTISQKLSAMIRVSYMDWVAAQEVYEFGEGVSGAVGYGRGCDGWWTEHVLAIQAREDFSRFREEDAEAEGEVVWAVSRVGEEVAGDLEVAAADGDVDVFFIELGHKAGN